MQTIGDKTVNLKSVEKLKSKRNHVFKDGNHIIKHFSLHDDYQNESFIYDRLENTSLAPQVLEKHENCIITEYLTGPSLFDALEQSINNQAEQIRLFTLFFNWYQSFRMQTGFILGDTNFRNFIINEGTLYGLDFETCKRGNPVEDIVWQTAMLATLRPVFSPERKQMARLFLVSGIQHLGNPGENISEKLIQAFEAVCKRRRIRLDAAALKEILSSIEVSACLLAGGKSSRMGQDKRILTYKNKPMIESIAETLILFPTKYLSLSKEDSAIHIKEFRNVYDRQKDCGPIGGIVSTLKQSNQAWMLFATSDMPVLSKEMLDYLIQFRERQYDAIIFSESGTKKIFPLLLQRETALPAFNHAMENAEFALWRTMQNNLKTLVVKAEDCPFYQLSSLKNINTKEDYEELKNF